MSLILDKHIGDYVGITDSDYKVVSFGKLGCEHLKGNEQAIRAYFLTRAVTYVIPKLEISVALNDMAGDYIQRLNANPDILEILINESRDSKIYPNYEVGLVMILELSDELKAKLGDE